MKNKVKNLIKNSRALDESAKAMYLAMANHLTEDKLARLGEIFEKEQKLAGVLDNEKSKEKSQINHKYIDEMEELYAKEYRAAVGEEERQEQQQGENILKKLDTV